MKEYIKKNGKILGWIDFEEKLYISERTAKHFFYKYNGWAISTRVLEHLIKRKINQIKVLFRRREYLAKVKSFFKFGIKHSNELDTKDNQIVLPLTYWQDGSCENEGTFEEKKLEEFING